MDENRIEKFMQIFDVIVRKPILLPQSGILIQSCFHASSGMNTEKITFFDDLLNSYDTPIVGRYLNYAGRIAFCLEEACEESFDELSVINRYYRSLRG